MNSMAASGCALSLVTAKVEPPCVPRAGRAGSHCGNGASAHSPFCPGRAFICAPASHAPLSRVSSRPCWMYESFWRPSEGPEMTRSSLMSRCQYSATRRVGASASDTFQAPSPVSNHCAPACQQNAAKWVPPLGTVANRQIRGPSSRSRTVRANSANSSQVRGTARPCWSNTSLR